MKAVCWHGAREVRVEEVADPRILNPRDALVRVTSTAICGPRARGPTSAPTR